MTPPSASPKAPQQEILAGGQAVLEGVMMKLPTSWAVTVRLPSGELATAAGTHVPWTDRWPVLRLPLLRGVATLASMMVLGFRSLQFSQDVLASAASDGGGPAPTAGSACAGAAKVATLAVLAAVADGPDGTEVDDRRERPAAGEASPGKAAPGGMSSWEVALSIGLAAGLFLVLFKALPLGVAWLAAKWWPALATPLAESLISGATLLAVFVSYLYGISLIPDIRRVFQYHGAEHKVVHVHERSEAWTVENARRHSTFHPRCGTSFLFFVVLTSVVIWSFVHVDAGFFGKLAVRLAAFPLVLGVSYELIRLSSRHRERLFFRALMAPGLWSQRITTKPPDDSMLAVSLNSLELAAAQSSRRS